MTADFYIRVTTRCNMRCGHCVFSCTERGSDMSLGMFRKVVKLLEDVCHDYGEPTVTVGGGEPTLNPNLFNMLGMLAVADFGKYREMKPLVVTNGKLAESAIRLAHLGSAGIIDAVLSLDQWHEKPDDSVVREFGKRTRTVSRLIPSGRAKSLPKHNGVHWKCPLDALSISPDGKIRFCGCRNAPVIGHAGSGRIDHSFLDLRESMVHITDACWNRLSDDEKQYKKYNEGGFE